jgi:putative hydrolase of the HAD superfamily
MVARQHEMARARGIPYPEVIWNSILSDVLPEFNELGSEQLDEFAFRASRVGRSTAMSRPAGLLLAALGREGFLLGIASNAQGYSVRELQMGLREADLEYSQTFKPDLCFWSFQHGFSKPDPHVFQLLTFRLEARGIAPSEILMVGDRLDNDIKPAQTFGWRTWWLKADPGDQAGDWHDLSRALHLGALS